MNIVGNIISGQVTGDTAKQLSERFGKIIQERQQLKPKVQSRICQIRTEGELLRECGCKHIYF